MATSIVSYLLNLWLLIFLSKNVNSAFDGRKIAQHNTNLQFIHTIQVTIFLPLPHCKHSTKAGKENKALLKVVHKHGPCSKLNQENANAPNLKDVLLEDQFRVDSIRSKLEAGRSDAKQTDGVKLPAENGRSLGSGNYVVSIGLGSPEQEVPLIFDTGSDLTWARCKVDQSLNPSNSTSYVNVTCSSTICNSLNSATGNPLRCASSTCVYQIQYGDGSFSVGFLATEKLTIASTDVFNNFYFGCGQNNQGLFGKTAGLLGLGRDKLSVVSQTASKYNKLFSYCLPASSSSTGFLSFGSSQSTSAKFTPLSSSASSFYNLDMTGISVFGDKLDIPASVFANSGTIIDSGTVITRLPPTAYSALRSAFRQAMATYPMAEPFSILDTCYDLSNYTTVKVPKIVLHFNGGVDVDVDKSGIFVASGVKQVCLGFAGNGDDGQLAIFGNTQQKNLEVVYDVGGDKVGFAPSTCSS
ncbi:aspartyl protease family protein At5g10770-like [Mercurialis annua]|uniref:aspartyl protease family protein At5g10770-like n=1 Tax=Mercurialis annua TaxID=3986 RepID=UPI00215FD5D3|nr:aspartyl protease family protein At5g10770-like [Mercurialis annua]